MARINFHDEIYKDPNYGPLLLDVGDVYRTKGLLLTAWELAQVHWLEHRAVPAEKWPDDLLVLVKHRFAREEHRDSGVFFYVSGSADHCAFLDAKSKGGKKGGKSKSPKKLANLRQGTNSPKQARNRPETGPKLTESSYSYSYSFSNSDSGSNLQIAGKNEIADGSAFGAQQLMAGYCSRFKAKYGTNPPSQSKNGGIANRLSKGLSREKAELYLDAFFAMPDAWLIKTKHPLGAMETKLNEIAVFAATGNFTTNRQVRQADDAVADAVLRQQIKEGNL